MLYFMVFGESLLNDAVTIVCYNIANEFKELESITFFDVSNFICPKFSIYWVLYILKISYTQINLISVLHGIRLVFGGLFRRTSNRTNFGIPNIVYY